MPCHISIPYVRLFVLFLPSPFSFLVKFRGPQKGVFDPSDPLPGNQPFPTVYNTTYRSSFPSNSFETFKGRHQNQIASLQPHTFHKTSQNHLNSSSSYQVGDYCRCFPKKRTLSSVYTLHDNPILPEVGTIICDFLHTFHITDE